MDSHPRKLSKGPTCPRCGGNLFNEVEYFGSTVMQYPKCLSCGREYYRSGSLEVAQQLSVSVQLQSSYAGARSGAHTGGDEPWQ